MKKSTEKAMQKNFTQGLRIRQKQDKIIFSISFCAIKFEVVVKEVYNGVLDFYVDYGFTSSIYDDWFWKIFYEKGSKGNKFSIWISDFDVYEEQRHMGICS